MAVKIRLTRAGKKKAPFYRVVATDSRSPRDGRFIEILGRYNPRTDPSTIEIDVEKVDAWVAKGAQMSETVAKLYAIAKDPEAATAPGGKTSLSDKDKARAEAKEKAAEEAKAAAEAPAEEAPAEEPAAEEEAPAEDSEAEVVAEEAPAEEAEAEEPEPSEEEAPAEEPEPEVEAAPAEEDSSDDADEATEE